MTDTVTTTTKPGYKTTEFYLSLAAQVISILLASGAVVAGTPFDKAIGFAGSILTALGYTIARSIVKSNA